MAEDALAVLGHEIRNPLSALSLCAPILASQGGRSTCYRALVTDYAPTGEPTHKIM